MNGYIAFYKGRKIEIEAETTYKAQLKAAALFKAHKTFEVTVILAEKNGTQVTHDTTSI